MRNRCIIVVGLFVANAVHVGARPAAAVPSFRYATTEGCSRVIVAGINAQRTEALVIFADRRVLGLSVQPKTFDMSEKPAGLIVRVDVLPIAARGREMYCTDLGPIPIMEPPGQSIDSWHPWGGTITIQLTMSPESGQDEPYAAIVRLENAEFHGPGGQRVKAPREIGLYARVGRPVV